MVVAVMAEHIGAWTTASCYRRTDRTEDGPALAGRRSHPTRWRAVIERQRVTGRTFCVCARGGMVDTSLCTTRNAPTRYAGCLLSSVYTVLRRTRCCDGQRRPVSLTRRSAHTIILVRSSSRNTTEIAVASTLLQSPHRNTKVKLSRRAVTAVRS